MEAGPHARFLQCDFCEALMRHVGERDVLRAGEARAVQPSAAVQDRTHPKPLRPQHAGICVDPSLHQRTPPPPLHPLPFPRCM